MKKIVISIAAAGLVATSGIALAQPGPGQRGAETITRDQAAARADQRFARLDADGDGRVTAAELRQIRAARAGQRQERRSERQARMFDRLDTNRDGHISREEFSQRRAARGNAEGRRGQMRAMDQRGERFVQRMLGDDGVMTRDEFRGRALERFARVDQNRDGVVTAQERREAGMALRGAIRERMQPQD